MLGSARSVTRTVATSRALPFAAVSRLRGLDGLDDRTEIVIEGFQRSGNTFAYVAFDLAQGGRRRIAHHTHAAGHVRLAAKRGLPTLVTVRNPKDSVMSYVQYYPDVAMAAAVVNYVVFHTGCLAVQDKILFVPFEDVTSDMGKVTRTVNERFGTDFVPFEHDQANVDRCFDIIEERARRGPRAARLNDVVPRPSAERKSRRPELERRYDAVPHALRNAAERAYRRTLPGHAG